MQGYVARLLGQPDSPELLRDLSLLRADPPPSPNALYTPFARNFTGYLSSSGRSPSDPDIAARLDARIGELRAPLLAEVEARIETVPSDGHAADNLNRILVEASERMGPGLREADQQRLRRLATERRDSIRTDVTRLSLENIGRLPDSLDGLETVGRWRTGIESMDLTPGQKAEVMQAAEMRQVEIADAVLAQSQSDLASLPETLFGLSRFRETLRFATPARAVASPPAEKAFSMAANARLEEIRYGALPEFRAGLASLPETRDGLTQAEARLSATESEPSATPLHDAYVAAAAERRDAIRAALDEKDRGRREAAIAAGGDPRRIPVRLRGCILLVGVRPDQACIGCEGLAADQTFGDAAGNNAFEQVPEEIAVPELPMPVLREGRVVGDRVGQIEAAEPAICQVQMHLFAEPALRPDAEGVADDQHPDHQLRIDRGPAGRAVERREMTAHVPEVDEAVDGSQQMIRRNMLLNRDLVEQRALRHLPRPHHRQLSLVSEELNQQPKPHSSGVFQHGVMVWLLFD